MNVERIKFSKYSEFLIFAFLNFNVINQSINFFFHFSDSYISHALNHSRTSHPFEKELRARIALHPSDMIPVPEFYPTISLYQFSRFYVINFQKTISYLLEKPYQTNCFKYDLGKMFQTFSK